MNFLYLGDFRFDWATEEYVAVALEAEGHQVTRVDERASDPDAVLEIAGRFRHDVLLFSKAQMRGVPWQADASKLIAFLREMRPSVRSVACWLFDAVRPDFSEWRFAWAKAVAPCCDLFATTDGGLQRLLGGFNVRTLRQGYGGPTDGWCEPSSGKSAITYYVHRDSVHEHPKDAPTCDVLHLGSVYGERRRWWRVLNHQMGSSVRQVDHVRGNALFGLLRSVRLVAGPPFPTWPGYWSNRLYVATGYGGCLACPTVEGMAEEGWREWEHYLPLSVNWRGHVDELRSLLRLPDERLRKVAEAGQRHCWEHYTYRHRVRDLVGILEELK